MAVSVGGATTTSVKICNRKKEKDRNGYHDQYVYVLAWCFV